MSADRRRQCRVQGGWARARSAQPTKPLSVRQTGTSPRSEHQETFHKGQVSDHGPLLFIDPKQVQETI